MSPNLEGVGSSKKVYGLVGGGELYNSVTSEDQVAVEAEDGLAPEEDVGRLVHLLDPLVDEGDDVPKLTEQGEKAWEYLRLASLVVLGVLVLPLVVGEEKLRGSRVVGVLT